MSFLFFLHHIYEKVRVRGKSHSSRVATVEKNRFFTRNCGLHTKLPPPPPPPRDLTCPFLFVITLGNQFCAFFSAKNPLLPLSRAETPFFPFKSAPPFCRRKRTLSWRILVILFFRENICAVCCTIKSSPEIVPLCCFLMLCNLHVHRIATCTQRAMVHM